MKSRDKFRVALGGATGGCIGAAGWAAMSDMLGAATGFVVTALVLVTFLAVTWTR